jgi:hypothetical protein
MEEKLQASLVLLNAFWWFVKEVNSAAYFVAACRPDKKGKTIEWMKSRTHYVLLHRSHPANNRLIVPGQNVKEGADYIKRQAHTRRAHSRVLRSPKFKNKIGQTIRIKACWVGPKEWQQSGSIYRLQERAIPDAVIRAAA